MPRDRILQVLHEALAKNRSDADALIDRLINVYRGEDAPERGEQVIALGFLVCARALRESSLAQEIAIREELQDLQRIVGDVLETLHRTQTAPEHARQAASNRRGSVPV